MPRTRQILAPIHKEAAQLEALPLSVVAYGRDLVEGEVLSFHQHKRAQLVYASRGVMTVTTSFAAYVIPPQRAVWMPGGIAHRIDARSDVAMRTLYIDEGCTKNLPSEVRVLQVSPLLRELIITAVSSGPNYETESPQSRVMSVILDQIAEQPIASLALPMPTDARLLRVVRCWIENPADTRSLSEWAKHVGASTRTLSRLFTAQTGMSFRAWRQQRRLLRALELLASGDTVTMIASEVGYDSTSAFIAMFRRCLGSTPRSYLGTDIA